MQMFNSLAAAEVVSPPLSDQEKLVREIIAQSLLSQDDITTFLTSDKSMVAVQLYAAECVGYLTRHHGNVYEQTHYVESAVWAYNCDAQEIAHIPPLERAYLLFAHDLVEMLVGHAITTADVVHATWHGDRGRIPDLINRLKGFEEDHTKPRAERLAEQIKRANNWPDKFIAYGYLGEKLSTYRRDLDNIQKDLMVFKNQDEANVYLDYVVLPRLFVIERLNIEDKFKSEFTSLVKEIQLEIANQLARQGIDRTASNDNLYTLPRSYRPSGKSPIQQIKRLIAA